MRTLILIFITSHTELAVMVNMKYLVIFLIVFSASVQTKGQSQNSELQFSLYNDSWGGGMTEIYDDLRTYGFHFEYYKKNKIKVESKFSYLSNQFDPDTLQRKSLDEVIVAISLPIIHFNEDNGDNLWVRVGALAQGSIFGSGIQQVAHSNFGVDQNDLPYYTEEGLHPAIGYSGALSLVTKPLKEGKFLQLKLQHSLDYVHEYMSNLRFSAPLAFETTESKITFTPSYIYSQIHLINNSLLSNVLKAESGLNFNLKVAGKTLFYYFDIFPNTGFSSGGIGVRISKSTTPTTVKKPNLEVEVGVLSNGYGYNFKYSFGSKEILNRTLKIILNHNYHTLLKRFIPDSPSLNGHGNQITLGADLKFLKTKETPRIINPYANLSVGNKVISIYSKTLNINKQVSHHFVVNNDLGFHISVPLLLNSKITNLNFSGYHRFIILASLTPEKESNSVNMDNSPYAKLQNAFGFGVHLKI